ncbi:OmpA family protein [Erwinia sp.]|uniref:OmpA family protein n=1 Tax=Erwinia citreus TaxID=558 RepID=UPI003C780796
MRRAFTTSVLVPTAIVAFALLWLLWSFLPFSLPVRWLVTLLSLAITAAVLRSVHQRFRADSGTSATLFSDLSDGPIVLVMGDGLDVCFGDRLVRKSSTGSLHRINDPEMLRRTVEQVWNHSPILSGRFCVMYSCLPDLCEDEGELRADIRALRQQLNTLSGLTGFTLPLVIQCQFSGPATPWILVSGDLSTLTDEEGNQSAIVDWQKQESRTSSIPVMGQAFEFIRRTLLDELQKPDRLTPELLPAAVSFRLGAERGDTDSLWSLWLTQQTVMQFSRYTTTCSPAHPFSGALFALLAPLTVPVQGGRTTKWLTGVLLFCALVALACSAINNRNLIERTGIALQRWHAVPMDRYDAKAASLSVLEQEALLLESWHRQGEPLRYGFGLYPGQRLWLALQQAIDSYIPPPKPEPKPAPKIVRLDSMSLFDTGKSELKTGSTKMLVNSLVGIKARPGWLIVVAGHTDNTGNPKLNQIISRKRAESVRDWMRDTGDVPESCFAVQGFGENRPEVPNGTPQGRALNRRVEISLVPQADACQRPDTPPTSSQDDGGYNNEMEK